MRIRKRKDTADGIREPVWGLFHMEVDPGEDGLCVLITGVRRILSFDGECVAVATTANTFHITGKNLHLLTFGTGSLRIYGRIGGFCLENTLDN